MSINVGFILPLALSKMIIVDLMVQKIKTRSWESMKSFYDWTSCWIFFEDRHDMEKKKL